ncbi:MAG: ABC transporter ATP-binding protein [Thermaerobacter sp.]|nr:ABC transporter ATP-binding protein [Thermaerobacter sp.]
MSGLAVNEVKKSYGPVEAVKSVTFTLEQGQLMCLLGPSGCGKTTTLRMIAGLEFPDSGDILLGDRRLNALEPRERRIGMVFQGLALYPHMTALQNIGYPLKVRRMAQAEIATRVNAIASTLGIAHLLARRPSQLSGGEQQRVALARALVQEPELFLLDEPLSALDAKVRTVMREEIRNVQKRLNITTVLVSHDQLDALSMADMIAVMKDGQVQQLGSPHDIYYQPANTFVAQFIGEPTMNLLDGELGSTGHLTFLGHTISVGAARSQSEPVVVGLRPQDFVALRHPTHELLEFEGKIVSTQPQGPDIVMRILLRDNTLVVLLPWTHPWSEGDTIRLGFPSVHMHLFNRYSGERLPESPNALREEG